MSAGAPGRLPAIAVKLNGVTANTKPSSGRYSIRFHTPGGESGCSAVDAQHELDVEAPEVDQLARGVDLRLVRGLGLAEHRRRVERVAPRSGEQVRGAEKHGGAVLPRRAMPVLPRLGCRRDRPLDLCGAALVHGCEHAVFRVRLHRLGGRSGLDVLAADHERDLEPLVPHLLEPQPEARALRGAGRIVLDRLVPRRRGPEEPGGAHRARFYA